MAAMAKADTAVLTYSGPRVALRGFGKVSAGFTATVSRERADELLATRWWSLAPVASSAKVAKTEKGKIVEDQVVDIDLGTEEPVETGEKGVSA